MRRYALAILVLLTASIPAYAAYAPGNAPFINTWLTLGTFDNDYGGSDIAAELLKSSPKIGSSAAGHRWEYFDDRLFSRNYDDYQDLYSYYHIKQNKSIANKSVFLHAYAWMPNAVDAQLRIGAHMHCEAWINGEYTGSTNYALCMKDAISLPVKLEKGWNRILLKVSNGSETNLGFYARLCDSNGNEIKGSIYSVNGPTDTLRIATQGLDAFKTGNLPDGYKEWPYVGFEVPYIDVVKKRVPHMANVEKHWGQASEFRLMAEGSGAPYKWRLADGKLPRGLSITTDGRIFGRISSKASVGEYKFTVEVKNVFGETAFKQLCISVKDRPTKWYEENPVGALIHIPGAIQKEHADEFAKLMKRQGYSVAMPICFGNASDELFRWESRFDPNSREKDVYPMLQKAFTGAGIRSGIYIGYMNYSKFFTNDQIILMMEDALIKCQPAAIWLDWAADEQYLPQNDALFSMMKSLSPDILVIVNAGLLNGDWDIASTEDSSYGKLETIWDYWPDEYHKKTLPMYNNWPKTVSKETWRLMKYPESGDPTEYWQEFMRCQLSLICEGHIVNLDHTLALNNEGPFDDLYDYPQMKLHKGMADWANPDGMPSLLPSYTNIIPNPISTADWGYSLLSADRMNLYLHMIKNPRGKTGLTDNMKSVKINIKSPVESAVWMNKNKPLDFEQNGTDVAIDLTGVSVDPVDTVIKLKLKKPMSISYKERPYKAPEHAWGTPKKGNLAAFKPSKLLSLDCTRELYPSTGFATAFNGTDCDIESIAQGAWDWAWTFHTDLGKAHAISKIVIYSGKTYATEYAVKISEDGENWTEVAHVTDGKGETAIHKFKPMKARYVRVFGIKPDGENQPGGQMSIAELEVYEK